MSLSTLKRREWLGLAGAISLGALTRVASAKSPAQSSIESRFMALEKSLDGRLGVFAFDSASGTSCSYRSAERFPFCSTFKLMLAAAVLQKSRNEGGLLQQRFLFNESDFAPYSPITKQHIADGMTVAELCAAAIQYSDNTAANLLMQRLGGPAAVTAFARSIGDTAFQLDRWETALNTSIPGDRRDTTTPEAMATSLRRLVLDDALGMPQREILQDWLRGNTTGAKRIRAGVPADWIVGDKTGTGDYGTANDVAVVWPPGRAPLVIAVYTTRHHPHAKPRDDVIAAATRVAVDAIGHPG